jgi:hypothetical protein
MAYAAQTGLPVETELGEEAFAETPFVDPTLQRREEPSHESYFAESLVGDTEFVTPFLSGESVQEGESEALAPEAAEFGEIISELKDTLFRESLEQLADEALEAHHSQLSGLYGDRETRDLEAERLLNDHFAPLAAQAETLLDRFFERVEGYEAEALTDTELDRISSEVMPTGTSISPASEQFLGGLLRKAGHLVSGAVKLAKKGVEGAVKLAGKGLSALGKLALGPLLAPLKELGKFLLRHVVKFALGQLPPTLRPIAQQLSAKLFKAIGETHEGESADHEQTESEVQPAAADAAHLEAEFDVHVAQLLFTSDQSEIDHMVSSYGEGESSSSPLSALDGARSQLVKDLSRLQPGENPQPIMEQFVPAVLWPAAKTAITILGRPKLVDFLGKLLSGLIKPLIGANFAGMLAPAIADAGLRIFGLETNYPEPRVAAAEALAATIEETISTVSELPPHVLENEALLSDAVHEAFENAASSYFPNSVIKPDLRESFEHHGMWTRMPASSERKRYAKYSDTLPVEIPSRLARGIDTFGHTTLHDHLRDQYGHHGGRPYKGHVSLYQALPGTRASTIARAEGFPASQLHPLTPQAAGALLGQNAGLARRPTPGAYLSHPEKLHVNQRLYRIAPPHGHRHHHHRHVHSEILINLLKSEIQLWLYLSEPLCQRIASDLGKPNNLVAALAHLKPLLRRTIESLVNTHQHLSPRIHVVTDRPNLSHVAPHWLKHAGHHLGAKVGEWARRQLVQYFQHNADEFKRTSASVHDGVTLKITMTKVPGMELLRELSHGRIPKEFARGVWPKGTPAFHVTLHPGYAVRQRVPGRHR